MTQNLSRRALQQYIAELLQAGDAHVTLNNALKSYIRQMHVFYASALIITAAVSYIAGVLAINLVKYL